MDSFIPWEPTEFLLTEHDCKHECYIAASYHLDSHVFKYDESVIRSVRAEVTWAIILMTSQI